MFKPVHGTQTISDAIRHGNTVRLKRTSLKKDPLGRNLEGPTTHKV
jgi:hypothetical protein